MPIGRDDNPFLAAQAVILALVFAWPPLVHVIGTPDEVGKVKATDSEMNRQLNNMLPPADE